MWIFLELMDGGAFTSMLEELAGNYSEGFCKYTLYKTVQGCTPFALALILRRAGLD